MAREIYSLRSFLSKESRNKGMSSLTTAAQQYRYGFLRIMGVKEIFAVGKNKIPRFLDSLDKINPKILKSLDIIFPKRIIAISSLFILLLVSCGNLRKQAANNDNSVVMQAAGPVFCADSAYAFCQKQCDFGPRTMNSKAHDDWFYFFHCIFFF